jgi:hypothetical protein
MRANRSIPRDLEGEGKRLKKTEVSIPEECWRNGASVEWQDLCEW